jgi:hypothetical protein
MKLIAWIIAWTACFLMLIMPATAGITPEYPLPITSITAGDQFARIPDWSQVTLRSLPPIQEDGQFAASGEVNSAAGYDLSRSWKAGQTADQYLKLGDLQTSFYPQIFNLYSIGQIAHLDVQKVTLSALESAAWQRIDDLVAAIPGLGNYSIGQIPAIEALLKKAGVASGGSLGALLQGRPELGQLNLGQLGKGLDNFAIADIPGLQNIPLQNLANWENTKIAGVPGLGDVPLAQMPSPIGTTGPIGTVDVVYGIKESDRTNTISGSHEEGFQVPCKENCAHVEMAGNPALYGKQWISGKSQKVKGGTHGATSIRGCL